MSDETSGLDERAQDAELTRKLNEQQARKHARLDQLEASVEEQIKRAWPHWVRPADDDPEDK